MNRSLYTLPLMALLMLLISGTTFADEAVAESAEATEAVEAAVSIDDLIKDLDADEFGTREKASAQLREAGADAVDPLIEAAQGDSREVTIRALDILKHQAKSEDANLKKASLEGLKQLSNSDDETIAQGAQAAIDDANKKAQPKPADPFGGPGRIVIGGRGGVKIQVHAMQIGGKGARKVSIKNVDGNKEIEATEDGREIKIKELAEGKIEMEVVEEKDGEKNTKKYEAKNADELKTIHPDAHKIYEKYSKQGGGFGEIKIAPIRIGPGGLPRAIPALPAVPRPALPDADADARIKEAMKQMEKVRERMEARIKEQQDDAAGDRVQALEKALENLERHQAELKRQLEEAKAKADEE